MNPPEPDSDNPATEGSEPETDRTDLEDWIGALRDLDGPTGAHRKA